MKELLSQKGVKWTEKYVDADRAAAIEMIRLSGQSGVPVTRIGDQVVVGFDRPRLERIIANMSSGASAKSGRKSLGAKVADASHYALPGGTPAQGAYVGGVNSGSPAEQAGIKAGDVITAVNGTPIYSVDQLSKAIASAPDGHVRLTLARGPNTREVEAQL